MKYFLLLTLTFNLERGPVQPEGYPGSSVNSNETFSGERTAFSLLHYTRMRQAYSNI